MARKKKEVITNQLDNEVKVSEDGVVSETLVAQTSTFEEKKRPEEVKGETVTIACRLPFRMTFDDVPSGNGGFKTVTFPSVNDHLIGQGGGVLASADGAVAVTLARSDWEAIKRMHGREAMFRPMNGNPLPCLTEMSGVDEFRSRDKNGDFVGLRHGLEPAEPKKNNVEERNE